MLIPAGLKGKEREKYIAANKWRMGSPSRRIVTVNKHTGLRVANPSKAQAEKQIAEGKAAKESHKAQK